jgi:plastocyanin
LIIVVLISACSINKTKPVVTDITGEVVRGVVPEDEGGGAELEEQESEEEAEIEGGEEETELEEGEAEEEEQEEEEVLPPGTNLVTIKDMKLDPLELTIKKGETVLWKHEDEFQENTRHFLSAHNGEFRSSFLFYGDTFNHTFDKEGTFTYFDIIYKDRTLLRGKIIVE